MYIVHGTLSRISGVPRGSGATLGLVLGRLGPSWVPLGAALGPSSAVMGPSWAALGRVGPVLGQFVGHVGPPDGKFEHVRPVGIVGIVNKH